MSDDELWRHSDEELLATLGELETRMRRDYGRMLALLGELQARTVCEATGYRSMPHLPGDLLRISRREANRRSGHAAAVTAVRTVTGELLPAPMPVAATATRDGVLSAEHLDTIHRTLAALPPAVTADERASAEQILVVAAHALDPGAIGLLGRNLRARLDQDGSPPTESELLDPRNELRCTTRANGRVRLLGELDAEGAALLATVLSPLAKPRPVTDGCCTTAGGASSWTATSRCSTRPRSSIRDGDRVGIRYTHGASPGLAPRDQDGAEVGITADMYSPEAWIDGDTRSLRTRHGREMGSPGNAWTGK